MLRLFITVILIAIHASSFAHATDKLMDTKKNLRFRGRIFEFPKGTPKHIFNFEAQRLYINGEKKLIARYTDLQGKVLSTETVEYKSGKIVSYQSDDVQTTERNKVTVEGKKIKMRFEVNGKSPKIGEEPLQEPFVAGPAVLDFIWESRGKLNYGEEVHFKYPVVSRLEIFTFTLQRKTVTPTGEDFRYVIELKPTSLFLRPFVSSQYFTVDFDNQRVISFEGRCAIPKLENGKLVEVVTKTIIDSQEEIR